MTIMVTGGDGYIGSHCVLALLKKGYDVIIFDSHETSSLRTEELLSGIDLKGRIIKSIEGNLLNKSDIDSVFNRYEIDSVIHFAAFSQVQESIDDPAKYYCNNVCGTMNLLDSMINHNVMKIVFSSTAAIYGEPEHIPIKEDHPQRPINPYGQTKLIIENIMDDYDAAYGLRSVRLRYFNVIGADPDCLVGEWHEPETHLVPNLIKSSFDDKTEFQLYGDDYPTKDGTCVRDYVDVNDLVDAHILALEYLNGGGKTDYFNIGSNGGFTVKEIISECEKVIGKRIRINVCGRRQGDPISLVADNDKAKRVLGWEINHSLKDGIHTALRWEKKRRGLL